MGWGGAGGLGWGAGLTELSNQREPIFRIRRQRPMLWAAANYRIQYTIHSPHKTGKRAQADDPETRTECTCRRLRFLPDQPGRIGTHPTPK